MNKPKTKRVLSKPKGSILRRFAAGLISLTMLPLMELPVLTNTTLPVAHAAETMNASKAIGINNDAAPDGFDEDDDISNPYGKKTVAFGEADEVYTQFPNTSGGSIIGDNVSNVGSKFKNEITCQDIKWVDKNGKEVKRFISDIGVAAYPSSWYDGKYHSNLSKAVDELKRQGYEEIVTYSNTLDGNPDMEGTIAAAGRNGDANMYRFERGEGSAKYNIAVGYKYTDDAKQAVKDVLLLTDNNYDQAPVQEYYYNRKWYWAADVLGCQEFKNSYGNLNMGVGGWTLFLVYTKDYNTSSPEVTAVTGLSMCPHGDGNSNSKLGVSSFKWDGSQYAMFQDHTDLNAGLDHYLYPEMYLHQTTETVRPLEIEGSTVSGKAKIQEKSAINKTAGGNFDGNTEGKKNHFAMVAAVDGELQLGVVEAKNPANSQTVKTIGTYSSSRSEVTLAAQMSIVSGDFDGNSIDDIAVYNPYHKDGSRVEIYSKTGSGEVDDINSWEIKRTIGVTNDDVISLSAGDINNDGIDDLVVAANDGVNVYSGARKDMLFRSEQVCDNSEAVHFSATVFREKIAGQYQNFIAVLGAGKESLPKGKLSVFSRDNKGNYTAIATTYAYLQDINKLEKYKFQLELVYADGRLISPYFNMQTYVFAEGKLTEKKLAKLGNSGISFYYFIFQDFAFTGIGDIGLLPYDVQVADLNGNGEQTVFFKRMRFHDDGTAYDHSFSAITPTEEDSIYMSYIINSSSEVNPNDYPYCYAVLNTDNDTSYLSYTGKHWFSYTDPAVLAVLSSPPYFKDLLENEKLSGNYAESTTSFGKTKGSGSSSSEAATVSAGAYIKYEQDFSILGVKIASVESEVETMASFTTEFEQASEISYTTEYSTSSGADAVVFYSIPYEFYEYDMVYYHDGKKHINKKTIAIPKQPCTATVELEKYQQISAMYRELPQLSNDVLKHTVGKPETYPRNTLGYNNVQEFDGNYMAVDFTSAGGGMTQSQSIEMTEEKGNSYSAGIDVTVSAGAGAGGVTVGVKAGVGFEASFASTSTAGCSFTAEVQNMPKEAEDYGYGMSWKMFSHDGTYTDSKGNTVTFPVVDYLVTDVIQPPLIPQNFRQDYQESSKNSIRLEWEYEDPSVAEEFNIYRITNINGRNAEVLVGSVAVGGGTKRADGIYSYVYIDAGQCANGKKITMTPGTQFNYRIEAVRSFTNPPPVSMPGDIISAYTHSDAEYPDIVLKGVVNNKLTLYPDRDYTIIADVQNADNFIQLSYQWQKRDSKNNWKNIKGGNKNTFEFSDSTSEDAGQYRCWIDALSYDEKRHEQSALSIATDEISIIYQMRTVKKDSFTVSCTDNKPEAILTLTPENPYCFVAPTGEVSFIIRSTTLEKSYTAPLKANGRKATAKLSATDLSELPEGVYEITAYYGGDNVFSSFVENSEQRILIGDSKIYPVLMNENGERTDTFYYGDTMYVKFFRYTKDAEGNTTETELKDETHPDGYSELLTKRPDIYVNNEIKVKLQGIEDEQTFQYTYTVTKRPIAVRVISGELFAGNVESHLPQMYILSGSLAANDVLSDIVDLTFMNKTGTTNVNITNSTDPGTYFAQLSALDNETAENYDIKLYSSAFTINAQHYPMNLSAELCEGEQAGTIRMTLPETKYGLTNESFQYESGTKLKFTAEANNGYQFDKWIINGTEYTTATVTKNMPREALDVQLFFKPYNGSISVDEADLDRVETPEGFENGREYPVGTELTFTALDNEDSVFDHWVKVTGSKTADLYTSSITLTVSNVPIMLYPVFVGAPRAITLGKGIFAEYSYVNAESETVKDTLTFGATVPNGAVLTLKALNADVLNNYEWYINGEKMSANEETITYTVTGDTSVELRSLSDISLYPVFTLDTNKLTAYYYYDNDGEVSTPDVKKNVVSGDAILIGTEVTVSLKDGETLADGDSILLNGEEITLTDGIYTFNISEDTEIYIDSPEKTYTIAVVPKDIHGNDVPAQFNLLANYENGAEVALEAPTVGGYNFVGWYNGKEKLSSKNQYTFTINKNADLVAKYEAIGRASLTINCEGIFTINDDAQSSTNKTDYLIGSTVTIATGNPDFAYWTNSYGMILSRSASYTFTVTGTDTISAVINTPIASKATLVFESAYGQVMARTQLASGGNMNVPSMPYYNGYTALGWDMNGDGKYDENDTLENAIIRGLEAESKSVKITPVYELNDVSHTIIVNNGTGSGIYKQHTKVTINANAAQDGQKFSCWEDEEGTVISNNPKFTFYADRSIELTAKYVDESEYVDVKGITSIISMTKDEDAKTMSFVSFSTVPDGCKMESAGIIATLDADVAASGDGFNAETARFVRYDAWNGVSYTYTWTLSGLKAGRTVYVRAYLIYTDENGNRHTVYGDVKSLTY